MTTTTDVQQPEVPEPSGADLARIALHAARAAARKNGAASPKPRRRRRSAGRGTARDPQGFGAVLQALITERAWELPAAGGSLLDAWADIAATAAPRLAAHVHAVGYDAETGRLDLRATSPAYATQARLMTQQLTAAANRYAGREAVRSIRITGGGPVPAQPAEGPARATTTPEASVSVKTRENASVGYRQALAAHNAARPTQPRQDPGIAAARQRQDQALAAHRRAAFASEEERLHQAEGEDTRSTSSSEASRARALRRRAAERARGLSPAQ